jgi:hypothetical protein
MYAVVKDGKVMHVHVTGAKPDGADFVEIPVGVSPDYLWDYSAGVFSEPDDLLERLRAHGVSRIEYIASLLGQKYENKPAIDLAKTKAIGVVNGAGSKNEMMAALSEIQSTLYGYLVSGLPSV